MGNMDSSTLFLILPSDHKNSGDSPPRLHKNFQEKRINQLKRMTSNESP